MASRFVKPTTQYLNPIKKPTLHKKAGSRLNREYTKILNTCDNGVGDYVTQVKRILFRIHPTSADCFHAREYISHQIGEVSTKYPSVSFYVTEHSTRIPIIGASYLNGYYEEQRIDNVREEVLAAFIEKYCNYSGDIQKGRMLRQQSVEHTRSIQGMWTPYQNQPQPNMNSPLSIQELKDKHRTKPDYNKFRGLEPQKYTSRRTKKLTR